MRAENRRGLEKIGEDIRKLGFLFIRLKLKQSKAFWLNEKNGRFRGSI